MERVKRLITEAIAVRSRALQLPSYLELINARLQHFARTHRLRGRPVLGQEAVGFRTKIRGNYVYRIELLSSLVLVDGSEYVPSDSFQQTFHGVEATQLAWFNIRVKLQDQRLVLCNPAEEATLDAMLWCYLKSAKADLCELVKLLLCGSGGMSGNGEELLLDFLELAGLSREIVARGLLTKELFQIAHDNYLLYVSDTGYFVADKNWNLTYYQWLKDVPDHLEFNKNWKGTSSSLIQIEWHGTRIMVENDGFFMIISVA